MLVRQPGILRRSLEPIPQVIQRWISCPPWSTTPLHVAGRRRGGVDGGGAEQEAAACADRLARAGRYVESDRRAVADRRIPADGRTAGGAAAARPPRGGLPAAHPPAAAGRDAGVRLGLHNPSAVPALGRGGVFRSHLEALAPAL